MSVMTDEEVDRLSTPDERRADATWKWLQRETTSAGFMTETHMLMASEIIPTLVARNKRLGLIP